MYACESVCTVAYVRVSVYVCLCVCVYMRECDCCAYV